MPSIHARRGRMGGLTVMARHGTDHMVALSAAGRTKIDQRIAHEAGIPDDLPPAEYAARLQAARRLHYSRLALKRWANRPEPIPQIPPAEEAS